MASFKGSGYLGLVVSIHLKNMRKSNGIISPIFEVKIKILETNHREIIIKLLGLFSTHRKKYIYIYISTPFRQWNIHHLKMYSPIGHGDFPMSC